MRVRSMLAVAASVTIVMAGCGTAATQAPAAPASPSSAASVPPSSTAPSSAEPASAEPSSNLPTSIGPGEGEVDIIVWAGYAENGENIEHC